MKLMTPRDNPSEATRTMPSRLRLALLAALLLVPVGTRPTAAQEDELGRAEALQRIYPDLHDLVLRLQRAHGVLLLELATEGEVVRATGEDIPTFGFEFDMVHRLTLLVQQEGAAGEEAANAEAGYALLGERGAEIVRWGQALQREVLSILADPDVPDVGAALDEAVRRYLDRPDVALPSAPKDMEILYDHAYALGFRTGYADLDGLLWAGHWLRLAATEPLTDLPPGPEQAAGIDTVTARFQAKLSYGEPPDFFPSEIPLAPAIAPGLIWLSPEAAMIWDNLSLLLEVVADVLATPEPIDVTAALDAMIDFFTDPELAVTDQDEWEIMALRHGIFFQGGYPLAVMTESELNADSHAAHLAGGAGALSIPGMPRR
jgi:hypothetical protein